MTLSQDAIEELLDYLFKNLTSVFKIDQCIRDLLQQDPENPTRATTKLLLWPVGHDFVDVPEVAFGFHEIKITLDLASFVDMLHQRDNALSVEWSSINGHQIEIGHLPDPERGVVDELCDWMHIHRNFTVARFNGNEEVLRTLYPWIDWVKVYRAKKQRLIGLKGFLNAMYGEQKATTPLESTQYDPDKPMDAVIKEHFDVQKEHGIDALRRKLVADGIDTMVAAEVAGRCAEYAMSAYKEGYDHGFNDGSINL